MQRNRVASGAMLIAILFLAIGMVVSVRQTNRVEQQAQRTEAVTRCLIGLFNQCLIENAMWRSM